MRYTCRNAQAVEVAELYGAIYICRVPGAQVDQFLRIQQEAAQLSKAHGGLDDITWTPADLAPMRPTRRL